MAKQRFQSKIDNEQTAQLPAAEFRGIIEIIDSEEQIEQACRYLAAHEVIGFDTETRPSFRAGVSFKVSLLQLSTDERCFLFRLNRIPLAKPILQLLENPKVQKIGVDVTNDICGLNQLRHFRAGGFIDLQNEVERWGIEEKSLRKISALVLGKRISKAQRLSNWESTTLTDKQQLYAATDAWACVRIYRRLNQTPPIK